MALEQLKIPNEIKGLEDKVTSIEDRGYLNTKTYSDIDLNTLTQNGNYYVYSPVNSPTGLNGYVEVVSLTSDYCYQVYTVVSTGEKYIRYKNDGVWNSWTQLTTNQILNDRGYLDSKKLPSLSYVSEIPKKNGKYCFISNLDAVDFPVNFAWLSCDVTVLDDENVEYKLRTMADPITREWRGNLTNNVWRGWQEIVSKDKVAQNRVLTNTEEVNNPDLESGIYSLEGATIQVTPNKYFAYCMLIVNKHRVNSGYGTQMLIPYDNGAMSGIYYRICRAGTWNAWQEISTNEVQFFSEGETIQSFCETKTNKISSTKFVLSPMFPTDLPLANCEGWVTVMSSPDNARKRVIFKRYLTNEEYCREMFNGVWGTEWAKTSTTKTGIITLNGFSPTFTDCKVTKNADCCTFNFSLITTGPIASGTVIATIPQGFYPPYNFHIHPWAYSNDIYFGLRAWITTDGQVQLHGGESLPSGCHLEFSRTMVF